MANGKKYTAESNQTIALGGIHTRRLYRKAFNLQDGGYNGDRDLNHDTDQAIRSASQI